jgi:hypothetical protein
MGNGFFQHGEFGPVDVCVDRHMLGGQWGGGGGAGAGRYGGDIVCSTLGSLHRGVGRGGRGEGWEEVGGVKHLQRLHELRMCARAVLRSEINEFSRKTSSRNRLKLPRHDTDLSSFRLRLEDGLDVSTLGAAARRRRVGRGCCNYRCIWRRCSGGCACSGNSHAKLVRWSRGGEGRGGREGTFQSRRVFLP